MYVSDQMLAILRVDHNTLTFVISKNLDVIVVHLPPHMKVAARNLIHEVDVSLRVGIIETSHPRTISTFPPNLSSRLPGVVAGNRSCSFANPFLRSPATRRMTDTPPCSPVSPLLPARRAVPANLKPRHQYMEVAVALDLAFHAIE